MQEGFCPTCTIVLPACQRAPVLPAAGLLSCICIKCMPEGSDLICQRAPFLPASGLLSYICLTCMSESSCPTCEEAFCPNSLLPKTGSCSAILKPSVLLVRGLLSYIPCLLSYLHEGLCPTCQRSHLLPARKLRFNLPECSALPARGPCTTSHRLNFLPTKGLLHCCQRAPHPEGSCPSCHRVPVLPARGLLSHLPGLLS
jgi:hypothetical protein